MKRFAANYIFDGFKFFKNAVLTIDDNGKIVNLEQMDSELPFTEFFNGIIVPGFVNAHCHLELSYLKGKIPAGEHLIDFLSNINNLNKFEGDTLSYAYNADNEMFNNGVKLVGDICNTAETLPIKKSSKIVYKNFFEFLGTSFSRAEVNVKRFNDAISSEYDVESVVMHAPYSVSGLMAETINNLNNTLWNNDKGKIISIHNQETEGENLMYRVGDCDFREKFGKLGIDLSYIKPTGKSSLQSFWQYLKDYEKIILVHNTFIGDEDLDFLSNFKHKIYFALCPKSNLLLEHTLPRVDNFLNAGFDICIGTDSLSSNSSLSVLDEILVLQNNFPNVDLSVWLKAATIDGACALREEKTFGSFNIGTNPGVVLLENVDLKNLKLLDKTSIKVLV